MLSQLPINFEKVSSGGGSASGGKKDNLIDKEIARLGMIAELDAVSLYEQLAATATNIGLKKVLLDIAKEEKTHIGEFETMLLKFDKEQIKENENAKKEIKELTE